MVKAVPDILARIVKQKKLELLDREQGLEAPAEASLGTRRNFAAALQSAPVTIIAEIKKASPSKGVLAGQFDPASIAQAYQRGGAAALSVLTDREHFQGSLEHLRQARAATALPVLRKDFTIDEYQIVEAAAHGADAILLIAAVLDSARLRALRRHAEQYALSVLVEVHDDDELAQALDSGAGIVGVNNRDLRTFEVDLATSLRLAARIPAGVVKVAESGIRSAADISVLRQAGFQAFLVGEHLMRSADPEHALRDLLS